jgi:hypothetical protein
MSRFSKILVSAIVIVIIVRCSDYVALCFSSKKRCNIIDEYMGFQKLLMAI